MAISYRLRDYQEKARHLVNTEMNQHRNPVFVSPTGTGKTKTAVAIIADRVKLGGRVFVLVPQIEIFGQWVKDLTEAGLMPGQIRDGKITGVNRKVYVVMPLTLVNMLRSVPKSLAPTDIVTDECHHSEASSWKEIYAYYPDAVRLGLTATPKRTDGLPLAETYDSIISTITMKQAVENGFLARPLCIVPEEFALNVPVINGDYDVKAQAQILGEPKIVGDIMDMYGRVFLGKPAIVACCNFEHARYMTEQFRSEGWNFEHIHSNLPDEERKAIIRRVREGKLNGICTVGIGIEGMDIPGLYGLIWLRRTMSVTIYLQFCGRVLRPMEDKEYGVILDPVGNVFIHGFPEADRQWSLDGTSGETEEKALVCPCCGTVNSIDSIFCTFCGEDLFQKAKKPGKGDKKRKIPSVIDGRMVILEEGMIRDVDSKIEEMKHKAEEIRNSEKAQAEATKARALRPEEKVRLFRQNIFKPANRENFYDALKLIGGKEK